MIKYFIQKGYLCVFTSGVAFSGAVVYLRDKNILLGIVGIVLFLLNVIMARISFKLSQLMGEVTK